MLISNPANVFQTSSFYTETDAILPFLFNV